MRHEVIPGFVEEVETKLIKPPRHPLRARIGPLDELVESISKLGLLQPIVIRAVDNTFEVVGGSRRLAACKKLGMRKILCHILTLDDKTAFEASLVENVQHRTLDPIEEANAFKNYVEDYGYGGETELANKIGKSEQYVSARIRLLSLPHDVVEKISRGMVTPSHAIEMIGLDESQQRLVSDLIATKHISTREARRISRAGGSPESMRNDPDFVWPGPAKTEGELGVRRKKILGKCLASLRSSMIRFAEVIEGLNDDDWLLEEMLVLQMGVIHKQIDQIIRFDLMTNRSERNVIMRKTSHPGVAKAASQS